MVQQQWLRPTDDDLAEYDPIQLYRELRGRMTQQDYADSLGLAYHSFRRWWQGTSAPTAAVYRRRAAELRRRYQQRGWL